MELELGQSNVLLCRARARATVRVPFELKFGKDRDITV